MTSVLTVAFDADDTLWHNEDRHQQCQRRFEVLLAPWADADTVDERLHRTQMSNLPRFGYGVKSLTLSMVETAIDISSGQVASETITAIVEMGKELLDRPVELLPGVVETIDTLDCHRLMVITKGDLHNQTAKMESSKLADRFWRVEVVAEKDTTTYADVLSRHGIDPARFVMVGNSLRSDVLPVLELGGRAVHVPYHVTWRHEAGPHSDDLDHLDVPTLACLRELPAWLDAWSRPA